VKKFFEFIKELFLSLFQGEVYSPAEDKPELDKPTLMNTKFYRMIAPGMSGDDIKIFQKLLIANGFSLPKYGADGKFGKTGETLEATKAFQKSIGLKGTGVPGPQTYKALGIEWAEEAKPIPAPVTVDDLQPIYPKPHPYHPRFNVPKPYTHLHPIDVLRSFAGQKEIKGSKDNPLLAHIHEHSGNLGKHSDNNDYSDEVAGCSSGLNWAADMSGCAKSDNALAASWAKAGDERIGDWVEEGDPIWIQHPGNHVTLANRRFNRRTEKYFEGFGVNQSDTIKTSTYETADIRAVRKWKPLPGTKLAPIGILGTKPTPVSGSLNESTR
jgi:hypothetical protein